MNSPKSHSVNLSQASGLLCSTLTLLTGLIVSLLCWQTTQTSQSAAFMENLDRETRNLSLALAPALITEDRIRLNIILTDWSSLEGVSVIRVLTTDGEPLAEKGSSQPETSNSRRHITQDQSVLGELELEFKASNSTTADRALSLGLITTALLSLIAGIGGYLGGRRLAGIFRKIQTSLVTPELSSTGDLTKGIADSKGIADFKGIEDSKESTSPLMDEVTLGFVRLEELDSLIQVINQQEEKREKQHTLNQALNRFLLHQSKPVGSTSTYHRCAMLYIEIQDLEDLQSRLSAEELANCLSEYHRLLSQAAKLYNGRLDRYQGDGLVMTFGLNEPSDRDTLHCLFAAWLCINLVRNAQQQSASSLTQVSFRCAAHWGPILLTPIQNEDDSGIQYSLIGDSLYWTSHLARRSEEFAILVSQTLIQELPEDTDLQWLDGPETQDLQGNSQANFWLSALPETSQTLIERQAQRILSMTAKT